MAIKPSLVFLVVLLGLVFVCDGAPSSPWNQAGLNLIFKPDVKDTKDDHHQTTKGSSTTSVGSGNSGVSPNAIVPISDSGSSSGGSSSTAVAVVPHGSTTKKKPSRYSWGYSQLDANEHVVRHRKQKVPTYQSPPCPKDYMRFMSGKCRRIPSFGGPRIG